MKNIFLALTLFPMIAFSLTEKEYMEGADTTPLKVLCKIEGGASNTRLLIQFVKDKQADPGIYSVVGGIFYPGDKIVNTGYEMIGESYSKIGHLDNGGKVIIQVSVDGTDLVGTVDKTTSLFGEGAGLYNCIDLKLK